VPKGTQASVQACLKSLRALPVTAGSEARGNA
jgi:hypothetical protein